MIMKEYLQGLSSPFDSFLEEHILTSTFYVIQDEMKEVGYYAIHNGQLLTQFYIPRFYQMHLQKLFDYVLERHAVKSLFVPTCDELLLSLTIDKDFTINKHAYIFQDSQTDIPVSDALGVEVFRLAHQDDLPQIQHGLLLLEEVEWIRTEHPLFRVYLDIVAAMLEHQANQLYIGSLLDKMQSGNELQRRMSRIYHLSVSTAQAATMFYLNIQSWKSQPFIQQHYATSMINQLECDLQTLAETSTSEGEILWSMRQIAYERI